jgi:hypothetical protein
MSAKGEVFDAGSGVRIVADDSKFAGWKNWNYTTGAKDW